MARSDACMQMAGLIQQPRRAGMGFGDLECASVSGFAKRARGSADAVETDEYQTRSLGVWCGNKWLG